MSEGEAMQYLGAFLGGFLGAIAGSSFIGMIMARREAKYWQRRIEEEEALRAEVEARDQLRRGREWEAKQ